MEKTVKFTVNIDVNGDQILLKTLKLEPELLKCIFMQFCSEPLFSRCGL